MRASLGAVMVVAVAGLWATTATAALPKAHTTLAAQNHGTGGHDTHVQFDIASDRKVVAGLTMYVQDCSNTVYAPHRRINDDGTFSFHGELPEHAGTWTIAGQFTDPTRASGTWSMTSPGFCDLENV